MSATRPRYGAVAAIAAPALRRARSDDVASRRWCGVARLAATLPPRRRLRRPGRPAEIRIPFGAGGVGFLPLLVMESTR